MFSDVPYNVGKRLDALNVILGVLVTAFVIVGLKVINGSLQQVFIF
jgi:hypothetical protein